MNWLTFCLPVQWMPGKLLQAGAVFVLRDKRDYREHLLWWKAVVSTVCSQMMPQSCKWKTLMLVKGPLVWEGDQGPPAELRARQSCLNSREPWIVWSHRCKRLTSRWLPWEWYKLSNDHDLGYVAYFTKKAYLPTWGWNTSAFPSVLITSEISYLNSLLINFCTDLCQTMQQVPNVEKIHISSTIVPSI